MAKIGTDILDAIQYLKQGEIIGLPTETVYGLAGNAYVPEAVLKIFSAKRRPSFDPLIVHTNSIEKVKHFVDRFPEEAMAFASNNWPGPVTLILPKQPHIPDLVTSGLNTVAVRIPSHPIALEVLSKIDFPLAAPSANPFGYISPTTSSHVNDQLGDEIPYILEGGPSQVGIESTIIDFTQSGPPVVLRLGGLTIETLQNQLGQVSLKLTQNSNPSAPGMLDSHYSPKVPLVLGDIGELLTKYDRKNVGIICWDRFEETVPVHNQCILSPTGDLDEAAHNLFASLRKLDNLDLEVILSDKVPEAGLGKAINDRLLRASHQKS